MPGGDGAGGRVVRWVDGPIVGRDRLLDELEVAATDAAGGAGSVVLLRGEAGIGKTTVVRALARRAPDRVAVTWGSCVADRSAPAFWPWRALLDVEARGTEGAGALDAVGAPRFERLVGLTDRLLELAQEQPRLHVIEDLQWADVASVLLLGQLAASIHDAPVLVVATERTGEPQPAPLAEAVEELRRTARQRDLLPLEAEDVAALLRVGGAVADPALVDLVARRTGGNPLFVVELLRALPALVPTPRLAAVAAVVPDRVTDLATRRLARLPEAVADVLVTAAVIGAEGSTATLAAAHGRAEAVTLDLLDQARAAHLLDAADPGRWRFRHHLIRDAVYASEAASARAQRHAVVLEALAADPTSPAPVVAHHALAALPVLDADRAVALAAGAGQAAFAQHAYEEAVEWFGRALDAAPRASGPRWRAELLVLCGEALRQIGHLVAARRAFLDAADLSDDPALLARAALGHASPGADLGIAYRTDDLVSSALLERAIAAQPEGDTVLLVQLEARLAAELHFSDEPWRARSIADGAMARARRLADPRALAVAGAVVHDATTVGAAPLDRLLAGSAELLDWARRSGSTAALLTAHRARVMDLLAAGDLVGVDAEILAFRRLADPLRTPGYDWWPALWSAMRALLDGRHALAEERASAAFELGAGPFPTLAFGNLSFLLFFLRREQGRLAELEQATREYAASHVDIPAIQASLAFLLAELGRTEEATGALSAFDEAALARLRDRNWPASWFQLARAAWVVGDVRLAAALLDAEHRPDVRCVQVSLGTACLGAADLAEAWLRHTTGDRDGADGFYRSAAEVNARLGARSWLAQTRADHARLLLERAAEGDEAEARRLQGLAEAAAAEIGLATLGTTAAAPAAPATPSAAPTFRIVGAVWEIGFADREARLPDARGLRDLAYLLARPGTAVSVLELAGEAGTEPSRVRGAEALDDRARREIRMRLQQLDEEEADAEAAADGERAALAREARQELAEAVARDFGLGGRTRLVGDPVERARKTVSTRIRRTIAAVAKVHPELGRHLDRSIDTGTWCAYRPAEPVTWRT